MAYPLDLGGRPLNSWQTFIIPAFEVGILAAGFSGVVTLLWLAGLPRPHSLIFAAKGFDAPARTASSCRSATMTCRFTTSRTCSMESRHSHRRWFSHELRRVRLVRAMCALALFAGCSQSMVQQDKLHADEATDFVDGRHFVPAAAGGRGGAVRSRPGS